MILDHQPPNRRARQAEARLDRGAEDLPNRTTRSPWCVTAGRLKPYQ